LSDGTEHNSVIENSGVLGYDNVFVRPHNSKTYGAFTKNSWGVQEGKQRDPFFLDPSTLEDEGTALLGNAAKHPASAAASIPETRILFSVYFAHDGTLLARTYWLSVSKTPVPQASQRLITIHLLMQRCKVQWWSTGTGRGGGGSISFLSRKKNSC